MPGGQLPANHPVSTVYVDETGWASGARFFGIGALKLRNPDHVAARMRHIRTAAGHTGRLRWADIERASEQALEATQRALRFICSDLDSDFACVFLDRKRLHVESHGGVFQTYNRLAARALAEVLDDVEISGAILDRFDAPNDHAVEEPVRIIVNDTAGRLALSTVQRVASDGVDALQLCDLLLGAITYQVREAHEGFAGVKSVRRRLSLRVLTRHYGLTSYVGQGPGRLERNNLTVVQLPFGTTQRGRRAGRRHTR